MDNSNKLNLTEDLNTSPNGDSNFENDFFEDEKIKKPKGKKIKKMRSTYDK